MRAKRWIPALKWALFALLTLFAWLTQTTLLGRHTFFGSHLSLFPVAAVSVAVMCGAERGSLFCLIAGILYCFTGADMGPVTLVAVTLTGALAGGACQTFFRRHLAPCAMFAALALLLSDGSILLLKLYFTGARPAGIFAQTFAGLGLSLLSVATFFPLSYAISRIGGERHG